MSVREGKIKAEADYQEERQRARLDIYCFKNIAITKCNILYCTLLYCTNLRVTHTMAGFHRKGGLFLK